MESIKDIKRHYLYTPEDDKVRKTLAEILLPAQDRLAEDFYAYLMEDPYTAEFFKSEAAVHRREETIKIWLRDVLTSSYNNAFLSMLKKIGKIHVKIGLKGHHVNASMNFIRSFCQDQINEKEPDPGRVAVLTATLNKILDISLDVMTSSYREEELKKVFLSHKLESALVRWAERVLHGLNLILMIGLLALASGVTVLLGSDILSAFTENLETGIIKTLGSILVLWMMVELLHTQVENLRGGRFRVIVFVELALVAFIRKIFVASIEKPGEIRFALLLGALLILGLIFYFIAKAERNTAGD